MNSFTPFFWHITRLSIDKISTILCFQWNFCPYYVYTCLFYGYFSYVFRVWTKFPLYSRIGGIFVYKPQYHVFSIFDMYILRIFADKNPLIRHFQWKICLLSGIFVQNSGIFVHNSVEYSSKIVEFLSVIVEFVSVTVENLSKSVEFLSMKKSQIPLFSRLFNLTTYYYILITIYYVN